MIDKGAGCKFSQQRLNQQRGLLTPLFFVNDYISLIDNSIATIYLNNNIINDDLYHDNILSNDKIITKFLKDNNKKSYILTK